MKWISVKDRLPEIGQKVITFPSISDQVFEKYGFITSTSGQQKPITHWMPLPKPPTNQTNTEEKK